MKIESKYLIEKDILYDYDLSGEALMVLIEIKIKYRSNEAAFNAGLLEYYIYGYENTDRNKREAIIRGINELADYGLIKLKAKMSNSIMVFDIARVLEATKGNFYTSITQDEFITIISLDAGVNNYELLKFFLQIVGTFNSNKSIKKDYRFKIGNLSQKRLSELCNVSITTLVKYNNILVNNKLLCILNRKTLSTNRNSGKLYNAMSNIYSRYEDRDLCEKYLADNGFVKKDKSYVNMSNELRSLSQKYNYFQRTYKDKICEDMDKVNDAYNAGKLWNKYTKEDYECKIENGEHPSEPKYKDLSIFEQYGLTD